MNPNIPNKYPKQDKTSNPLINTNFAEDRLPIFWGPNQTVDEDGIYVPPSGFQPDKKLSNMDVVRFIYDDYDYTPLDPVLCPGTVSINGTSIESANVHTAITTALQFSWNLTSQAGATPGLFEQWAGEQWRIVSTLDTSAVIGAGTVYQIGEINASGQLVGASIIFLLGNTIVVANAPTFNFSVAPFFANPPPTNSKVRWVFQMSCEGVFPSIPSS